MNESSILEDIMRDEIVPDILSDPKSPEDLMSRIVHYGAFLDGLTFVSNILKSTSSVTMILRGQTGSGKKSLLKEAFKLKYHNEDGKKKGSIMKLDVIWLNPCHLADDYSAIRYIASQLNLKVSHYNSIPEVLTRIESQCRKNNSKLVIVLLEFEEFCRQKQCLLYCLTNLTQHGDNIALIGVTTSLDCTKNMEKRVRSRLITLFHDLSAPYRNLEEYYEFSSLLLGGHPIKGRLKERLKLMYEVGGTSIRPLKRFLLTCCSWRDGRLTVDEPDMGKILAETDESSLNELLSCLTTEQLELLKLAVYHCFKQAKIEDTPKMEFSLQSLANTASLVSLKNFDITSSLVYKNVALLMKMGLFKGVRIGPMITQNSLLMVSVTPKTFKSVIENNVQYQRVATNGLWKRLT